MRTPLGASLAAFSVGQQLDDSRTHGVARSSTGESFEVMLSTKDIPPVDSGGGLWPRGPTTTVGIPIPGMVASPLVSGACNSMVNAKCEETEFKTKRRRFHGTEGVQLHFFPCGRGPTGLHLTAFCITAQGAALG